MRSPTNVWQRAKVRNMDQLLPGNLGKGHVDEICKISERGIERIEMSSTFEAVPQYHKVDAMQVYNTVYTV